MHSRSRSDIPLGKCTDGRGKRPREVRKLLYASLGETQERSDAISYTQPQPTLPIVSGNWWAQLLRGIAAVLFGLMALFWPVMTLLVLLVVFALYALVDGLLVIEIWVSSRPQRGSPREGQSLLDLRYLVDKAGHRADDRRQGKEVGDADDHPGRALRHPIVYGGSGAGAEGLGGSGPRPSPGGGGICEAHRTAVRT